MEMYMFGNIKKGRSLLFQEIAMEMCTFGNIKEWNYTIISRDNYGSIKERMYTTRFQVTTVQCMEIYKFGNRADILDGGMLLLCNYKYVWRVRVLLYPI